jgi:hypothetical protein
MDSRYSTPGQLVEALQQRADGARAQLWHRLKGPVGRLMDDLILRHRLVDRDRDALSLHALHSVETYLRTRPTREFHPLSWAGFRGAVLLYLAKMAFQPFGGRVGSTVGPEPLPDCPAYQSEAFFLPHEQVGNYWFGGDWYGGARGEDGSLWVLVADVTGHGYQAYLLASALPSVWRSCWDAAAPSRPADLLARMHDLLEDCLPDGVFVECTLARLGLDGAATVAPAGGSRLLLRRGGANRPDLLKLRGTWLGLRRPSPDDEQTWALGDGDELLLGSDGLFDQLGGRDGVNVLDLFDPALDARPLFDTVRSLLRQALRDGPQRDDITLILLRRRVRVEDGPEVLPFPESSARSGAGDVPV